MKKLIITIALFFSVLVFSKADAQISISINIGSQPTWGPTGYDHVDYYYFPDIDCYYYVSNRQFIYLSGSLWIYSQSLPPQYRSYDLYNGYKVVLNGVHKPYLQNSIYRSRYSSYRGRRGQAIIRDSHDPKYRPSNRPPARPQPKPQPKPQPNRPGHDSRPPARPQPKPQPRPQPKPQPKPQPSRPGNGSRPQPKPSNGGGNDKGGNDKKDDHR
jgi:hypothetical protein